MLHILNEARRCIRFLYLEISVQMHIFYIKTHAPPPSHPCCACEIFFLTEVEKQKFKPKPLFLHFFLPVTLLYFLILMQGYKSFLIEDIKKIKI